MESEHIICEAAIQETVPLGKFFKSPRMVPRTTDIHCDMLAYVKEIP